MQKKKINTQFALSVSAEKILPVHDDIQPDRISFIISNKRKEKETVLVVTPDGGFKVDLEEFIRAIDIVYAIKESKFK